MSFTNDKLLANVFYQMRARCNQPKNKDFPRYGGRGIAVSPYWNTAKEFANWAYKNGWKPGLTIDRINNNKDYSPENCTFVSRHAQSWNRHDNTKLPNGMLFREYFEKAKNGNDISYKLAISRYGRGWSAYDAVTRPKRIYPS